MSKEVKELLDRLDIVSQSRDRRPRMETPPNLPKGEECLMGASLDQYFRLKITPRSRDRRPRLSAHLRRLVNKKLSV